MLSLHSVVIDRNGYPVRTTFLVPMLLAGGTCLPMESEQRSLKKSSSRCFLHSSPFCCLGKHGTVNLEALCQRWQSQRMERDQVHESLFGWEISVTLTSLTMWEKKKTVLLSHDAFFGSVYEAGSVTVTVASGSQETFFFADLFYQVARVREPRFLSKLQLWWCHSCSKISHNSLLLTEGKSTFLNVTLHILIFTGPFQEC